MLVTDTYLIHCAERPSKVGVLVIVQMNFRIELLENVEGMIDFRK